MAAAVSGLCSHLAPHADVALIASTTGPDRYPVDPTVRVTLSPSYQVPGMRLSYAPGFARALRHSLDAAPADLVHVHGLWMAQVHAACRIARQRGIPYVISPHGMLMPWAFQHRAWKKRIPWLAYQRQDLRRAACLVATSDQEAHHVRAFGFHSPVAVVPNGLDMPVWQPPENGRAPFRALFLGRLHPIKGLANLIDAWASVRPEGWTCVLAGPDENGYRRELESRVASKGLQSVFSFAGPVSSVAKWEYYRRADLFILPSFTENFGLVVAEALACGVPAIATDGTPWKALVEERCGWVCAPSVQGLANALHDAVTTDHKTRRAMGDRGRRMVESRYKWESVCAALLRAYGSVCGRRVTTSPLDTA